MLHLSRLITISLTAAACAALCIACSTLSSTADKNNVDPPFDKPIAHRGLFDNDNGVPENSLKAFRAAENAGFPFELDVRMAADGKLFVFHDDDCSRMCGDPRSIEEMTTDEIGELRLLDTNERIPTFKEVLQHNYSVPILIEIKTADNEETLCPAIEIALDTYLGEYWVQSFSAKAVEIYKSDRPKVAVGILGSKPQSIEPVLKANPDIDFTAMRFAVVTQQDVERISSTYGVPVLSWTAKSSEDLTKSEAMGFAATVFDGFVPELT